MKYSLFIIYIYLIRLCLFDVWFLDLTYIDLTAELKRILEIDQSPDLDSENDRIEENYPCASTESEMLIGSFESFPGTLFHCKNVQPNLYNLIFVLHVSDYLS